LVAPAIDLGSWELLLLREDAERLRVLGVGLLCSLGDRELIAVSMSDLSEHSAKILSSLA